MTYPFLQFLGYFLVEIWRLSNVPISEGGDEMNSLLGHKSSTWVG